MRLTLSRTPRVDVSEALRYLRGGNGGEILEDLRSAADELLAAAQPAAAACLLPLKRRNGELLLGTLPLPGKAIARHLDGCERCLLLGVTLGFGVDRLISRAGQTSPYRAFLLDGCATAAVEDLADLAEEAASRQLLKGCGSLTRRFSPGYGDLPLSLQPPLLELLDARRSIGLTTGASLLLSPVKSVTALVGVSADAVSSPGGCAACENRDGCPYRK